MTSTTTRRSERFPASYDPETDTYVMDRDLNEAYPDPAVVKEAKRAAAQRAAKRRTRKKVNAA